MAEHINVDRKPDPSGLGSPLYHPGNAHPTEWLATLIHKHIRPATRQSLEPR
jgi:hypothetical protein